ncbi:MAG: hypothetical protein ABI999_08095 [Acidobacteriota bacterium]
MLGPIIASLCVAAIFSSCSSKPTDLRRLAPADALVYLETNDLAAAVQPVIDNEAFGKAAKSKPDLSALRGVQMAVVVTGFETQEEKVDEENSVGRVQPHFAAIVDTHGWGWQTRSFAENQLGEFINTSYGGGINLDTAPKDGGVSYVWTAEDGRKAFAFVEGSLIFFGNDQSAIDKCLAVKRGEADAIAKNPKLPQADPGVLADGYISPDGVAQISNLAGISLAMGTGEDAQVKSFIAGALPGLLRSSISDATWTATKTEQGIEDKWLVSTAPDVTNVFSETLTPSGAADASLLEYLPPNLPSVTSYSLKDAQRSWRSVLLVAQKQAEPTAGKILTEFSGSLFEPYGIRDIEGFLSLVDGDIVTAKFDAEGENPVVIASVKDKEKIKKTLAADLKPNKQMSDELGVEAYRSDDGDAAVFIDNKVIAGDADSVIKCLKAKQSGDNFTKNSALKQLTDSKATAATAASDTETAGKIAEAFEAKRSDAAVPTTYFVETRFTKSGIERRTVSPFGIIGSIIAELAPDN